VAAASALGDYYQYVIDRPVDLARQKSALLPIVNKDAEGRRVSIYNPAVQPKHPLLGLRFKNTSGMPLSQGPVTVFEGSVYAGDTRVLDLQPDEERLVSYAIDLGTEVSAKPGNNTSRITRVKAVKGIVYTNTVQREERMYDVSNRSTTDRTILIEHPNRKGQGFAFIGDPGGPPGLPANRSARPGPGRLRRVRRRPGRGGTDGRRPPAGCRGGPGAPAPLVPAGDRATHGGARGGRDRPEDRPLQADGRADPPGRPSGLDRSAE
jgi:hypothetical protein